MNRALVLTGSKRAPTASLVSMPIEELPVQGSVLVRIAYSSLNYKDGLAITGKGKIIRGELPFVPGIDFVGEVIRESGNAADSGFSVGDRVIGTGWGIGEKYWGGYSQHQWVDPAWLVPLPENLAPQDAMLAGTAGLTAMIAVDALERQNLSPEKGKILVTGASGGVGSFSVAILSQLGYTVVASTGKASAHEYLKEIGAAEVVGRDTLSDGPQHPMESARWAAAIDSVGAKTLESVIAQLDRHGSVAACGLAGGHTLNTTVFPFILRGVNLLGVDSNTCTNQLRNVLWGRLANLLHNGNWDAVSETINLTDLISASAQIVAGQVRGRIIVDVNA